MRTSERCALPVWLVNKTVRHLVRANAIGAAVNSEVHSATGIRSILVDIIETQAAAQANAAGTQWSLRNHLLEVSLGRCKGDTSRNIKHQQDEGARKNRDDQNCLLPTGR